MYSHSSSYLCNKHLMQVLLHSKQPDNYLQSETHYVVLLLLDLRYCIPIDVDYLLVQHCNQLFSRIKWIYKLVNEKFFASIHLTDILSPAKFPTKMLISFSLSRFEPFTILIVKLSSKVLPSNE